VKSEKGSPSAEIKAANETFHARLLGLMDRALTLARLHPGEPEGFAASGWVAQQTMFEEGDDIANRGDAAYRLLANTPVLDDAFILQAIIPAEVVGQRCPEVEPFLRSVISRSRRRQLVAIARFHLGSYLAEMARMHDRLTAPISGPKMMKELTKVFLDRCRAIDAPKLWSEAESLLEQVVRQDADLPIEVGSRTLAEAAAVDLFQIRHLRIGQPAPELVGEDIDGVPIRLSDFRGKVVALAFWATSNDPSMRLIGGQKDLVSAMKGRPFMLVGVNADAAADRAKVKEAVMREGITWRSFWAGGPDGVIPRQWGVQRLPTVYTIDAHGIIRDDQIGEKLDPVAFESLVRAAEGANR